MLFLPLELTPVVGKPRIAPANLVLIVAIGLIGWLFCSGVGMMGASGGVFAVMTIAMLLMPGARLLLACVICFPITVLVGLISPPKQYWLYWFIRAGTFTLKMYWCLLLIPLLLALEWLFVRIVLGVFGWGTAAHLLGMVCGVAIVLALPTRITMPGRRVADLL